MWLIPLEPIRQQADHLGSGDLQGALRDFFLAWRYKTANQGRAALGQFKKARYLGLAFFFRNAPMNNHRLNPGRVEKRPIANGRP